MNNAFRCLGSKCLCVFRLILGRSNRLGTVHVLVARAVAVVAVAALVRQYFPYQPVIVVGASMMPTLKPNQLVVIDRSYDRTHSRRNDIVVFRLDGSVMVKRVIGIPGDRLWLVRDARSGPYSNSVLMTAENVSKLRNVPKSLPFRFVHLTIPDGFVFVTGDNATASVDSRDFGCLNERQIVGKVCFPRLPASTKAEIDERYVTHSP